MSQINVSLPCVHWSKGNETVTGTWSLESFPVCPKFIWDLLFFCILDHIGKKWEKNHAVIQLWLRNSKSHRQMKCLFYILLNNVLQCTKNTYVSTTRTIGCVVFNVSLGKVWWSAVRWDRMFCVGFGLLHEQGRCGIHFQKAENAVGGSRTILFKYPWRISLATDVSRGLLVCYFYYFCENFVQWVSVIFILSSNFPQIQHTHFPTIYLCVAPQYKSNLWYPYILEFVAFYWNVVSLPVVTFLKLTLSPSSYQLPIVPQSGAGLPAHLSSPCWDFCLIRACTWLVHAVIAAVSACVDQPSCVWKTLFLVVIKPSKSYPSLLQWSLSLWRRGSCRHVPFRAGHFTISYSLHLDQLWSPVLIPICYKQKLLWWRLWEILIYRYHSKSLGVSSIIHQFSWFSQAPDFPRYGIIASSQKSFCGLPGTSFRLSFCSSCFLPLEELGFCVSNADNLLITTVCTYYRMSLPILQAGTEAIHCGMTWKHKNNRKVTFT